MDSPGDKHSSTEDAQSHFLRLFLSSERELFRYIAALVPNIADAEEIIQQTAVALWSKFDQYDPHQPFTPWACRFAINVVKQWAARRQKWRSLLDQGLAEQLASRREELRPQFESRMKHLDACLEKLPPEQRGIVQSYYFQRQTVETIAADAKRSVDAIYKTLQRVRAMLRDCIERASQTGESFT
jgi:RNA polymerase sigma-70 factor (ECF subfamily)